MAFSYVRLYDSLAYFSAWVTYEIANTFVRIDLYSCLVCNFDSQLIP